MISSVEVVIVNFLELFEVRVDRFVVVVVYLLSCVFEQPGKLSVWGGYFSSVPGRVESLIF